MLKRIQEIYIADEFVKRKYLSVYITDLSNLPQNKNNFADTKTSKNDRMRKVSFSVDWQILQMIL